MGDNNTLPIREQVAHWLYEMDYSTDWEWQELSILLGYRERADQWLAQDIVRAVIADAQKEIADVLLDVQLRMAFVESVTLTESDRADILTILARIPFARPVLPLPDRSTN